MFLYEALHQLTLNRSVRLRRAVWSDDEFLMIAHGHVVYKNDEGYHSIIFQEIDLDRDDWVVIPRTLFEARPRGRFQIWVPEL